MRDIRDVDQLIARIGDPILRSVASPVTDFGEPMTALLRDLFEVAILAGAAGLAAPQIGVLRRAVLILGEEDVYCLVNPRVVASSPETQVGPERCLSLPGVTLQVERPVAVTVEAFDTQGVQAVLEVEGHEARVVQHEIDHLDGRLIIDHVDRPVRGAALAALRYGKTYPDEQGD